MDDNVQIKKLYTEGVFDRMTAGVKSIGQNVKSGVQQVKSKVQGAVAGAAGNVQGVTDAQEKATQAKQNASQAKVKNIVSIHQQRIQASFNDYVNDLIKMGIIDKSVEAKLIIGLTKLCNYAVSQQLIDKAKQSNVTS
tara:strand:+ start:233 stop:646 length:414 start_codon:yes stop_codon:yes gene_type:complete